MTVAAKTRLIENSLLPWGSLQTSEQNKLSEALISELK
jgi:hypothetical protein